MKTVSQYKNSVAAILSGLDLSNVDNLNGALERAARTLVQKADVPEASGIQNITLYDGVYDYLCSTKIFGTSINDIRPQGISRNPWDTVIKTDQEQFDRTKGWYPSGTRSTFQWNNGTPIIRITAPFPKQKLVIDAMNSTEGWSVDSMASDLTLDSTNFYQSPASLKFNLTAGTGILTKTFENSFDIQDYQNTGVVFLAIYMPTASENLNNIVLNFGSDNSNYVSVTATEGFLGSWSSDNWLLVPFNLLNATVTGTPDWSAMAYIQLQINTTGIITNFHTGFLFASLPSPAQILHQSAAIFLPSGLTTTSTTITADTDIIILNDAAYTIYEYEGALAVLQQTGGGMADSTIGRIDSILNDKDHGLYPRYTGDNPSQEIRQVGSYYDNQNGYNNYGW